MNKYFLGALAALSILPSLSNAQDADYQTAQKMISDAYGKLLMTCNGLNYAIIEGEKIKISEVKTSVSGKDDFKYRILVSRISDTQKLNGLQYNVSASISGINFAKPVYSVWRNKNNEIDPSSAHCINAKWDQSPDVREIYVIKETGEWKISFHPKYESLNCETIADCISNKTEPTTGEHLIEQTSTKIRLESEAEHSRNSIVHLK